MESQVTKKRVKLSPLGEMSEGQGREVTVEGRRLAIFKANGGYFALANNCLHRGGPLSEGELNDYTVTCPWHGWKYDVRTGAFDIIPTLKVKSYRVEEKDGSLFIEIE
jgi:nitrite reductase/ring-hydroxylating ferredoxin subunit